MKENILFVTGKLAQRSLERVLTGLSDPSFTWSIRVPGVSVAALMTGTILERRLGDTSAFDRVILPGRCRTDLESLSRQFGTRFERGPEELKDLPGYFGASATKRAIDQHDVAIFAEIVDAPHLSIEQTIARAERYRSDGANVIDLGCLPDVPYPHLEDAVRGLRADGFAVSVDSLDGQELKRGISAGADYCFSLTENTLELVEESACVPILISPDPSDTETLYRTIDAFAQRNRPFYADAVIDPIHYGFTRSVQRYAELRERYPDIDIMMGIGNLSELTHTDSLGLNTLLMGIVSELKVTAVLTTEVSLHCRTAVREIDRVRRVMFAAREDHTPPRHLDESLMALHERHPYPYTSAEIEEFAEAVRDDNFRIQVNAEGIHVYNRNGHTVAQDPYDIFPELDVETDGAHAFYLGLELAQARLAWRLGKRYAQDEELDWGCILPHEADEKLEFSAPKSTLTARRRRPKRVD
jgi:dihydropteroate synthase-like protein